MGSFKIMRNFYVLLFGLLLSACKNDSKESLKVDLIGIWQYDEQIILIQDSIMINPFWDRPGFFIYSINNDTLIIEDSDLERVGIIDFINQNKLHLIAFNHDNDILKFERVSKSDPRKFKSLTYEVGFNEGSLPVFKMVIDINDKVTYECKHYSEFSGKHEIFLDSLSINQFNQLFEIVDIWNYPNEELLQIPGNRNMKLIIEYPEETIKIENGLFEGKYLIIQKVFNRFESLLKLKLTENPNLNQAE